VKIVLFILLLLQCVLVKAQQSIPPVGFWRDHLPYTSVIDIAGGGDKIYCATPYSVFIINTKENSIERMSRTTGLNETGVSVIYYDKDNEKLLVAYSNSSIDIIYRNDIINIADILQVIKAFITFIHGKKIIISQPGWV
jgi:hypothetical protein